MQTQTERESYGASFWGLTLFLPLAVCAGLNFCSQFLADRLSEPHFLGWIGLIPARDNSTFFGLLTHVPSSVASAISLGSLGFLFLLYGVIQWSLPTRSPLARIGLSVAIGALCGGELERIFSGHVLRFLSFGTAHLHTQPLNIGDGLVVLGAAILVANPWIDAIPFLHIRATRSSLWVNPWIQLRFSAVMVTIGAAFSFVISAFGYLFLRAVLNPQTQSEILTSFSAAATVLSVCFLVTLFFVGVVHSHRVVGPLYAFERFLADLLGGRPRELKLRAGDEFRHLEELANELSRRFETHGRVLRLVPDTQASGADGSGTGDASGSEAA